MTEKIKKIREEIDKLRYKQLKYVPNDYYYDFENEVRLKNKAWFFRCSYDGDIFSIDILEQIGIEESLFNGEYEDFETIEYYPIIEGSYQDIINSLYDGRIEVAFNTLKAFTNKIKQ